MRPSSTLSRRSISGRRFAALAAALATFVTTVVGFGVAPASAVQTFQPSVVSADPANWTPNVLDGEVDAIAQVGSTIVIGGTFTQLQQNTAGSPVITQPYIAAFDATTGTISATFHPTLDNSVQAIIPSGDGQSVYVAGYFNTVNGVTTRKVTRLNVTTGAAVAGFKAAVPNSNVQDIRLVRGNLIIAGQFTTVGGQPRGQLASLDPTTGKLTTFMQHTFAGPHNGGVLAVTKMDVTPERQPAHGDRQLLHRRRARPRPAGRPQHLRGDLGGVDVVDDVLRARLLALVRHLHARPGHLPGRHVRGGQHHRGVRRRRPARATRRPAGT